MTTFWRLFGLIAPFWRWVAFAALLSFLTIASGIALIATSAYLISEAAVATEVAALTFAITSVRVFAISRACFRYLERLVAHRATFRILEHLRTWFYSAIEPLAPARLSGYRSGDILSRSVADIETLEGFYVRVVVPPVAAALSVAFACGILATFGWSLAVVLLLFLLLAGVALPLILRRLACTTAAGIIAVRSDLNASLVDEVQGIADLLVFDTDNRHSSHVRALNDQFDRLQRRMAIFRGVGNGVSVALTGAAALAVLSLAIPLTTHGGIEPVYLALLPLTAIVAFEAVQPLAPAFQQLESNHAAGRRIFELIDAAPAVVDPVDAVHIPNDEGIEFRDVTFRYEGAEAPALDGLSFALPVGRRVGIVGPSGSGKSTIVNLLLRFWDYHGGKILLGGRSIRDYRADDVLSILSVVPQNVHLFSASIRDNLLLAAPDATNEEIAAACRISVLHDFIESLPDRYDTLIGENGLRLSGGERQRLAIARAVLKDAPIVILDEPTANLDPDTERLVMESLEQFLVGRTAIIISHRPVVIENVDQVVRLSGGRVVQDYTYSGRPID